MAWLGFNGCTCCDAVAESDVLTSDQILYEFLASEALPLVGHEVGRWCAIWTNLLVGDLVVSFSSFGMNPFS